MPLLRNLPLQNGSPIEEEFWINFTSEAIGMKSWIRKISITTFQGSIPSNWIYNMQIPSIEDLQITGNNWNIAENLLRNMTNLIHLNLSGNNLESLPYDMFDSMPNLKVIVLNRNSFSKFPAGANRLKKLIHLDLSNSVGSCNPTIEDDVKHFPKNLKILEMAYIKFPVNLEVLFLPQLHFLNISGSHLKIHSIRNNKSNVVVLDMSNMCNMTDNYWFFIPDNFFSFMPSLEILILNSNNLFMLPDFPLENNLTHLYASKNHIVVLTSETFVNLTKLEILDLSWCSLRDISEPIFQNGHSLKKINFSHNSLTHIPNYLFSSLPELQEVDISHNYIKTIHLWKWKLAKLDLSSNRLSILTSNMSAIEYIVLSYNYLQNLDIALSSLQILNLSHNSLSYISPELWENISQALEVDLGGNNFLCCSFSDTDFPRGDYDIAIRKLGTLEPINCFINEKVYLLFRPFTYDKSECRSARESIDSFIVVITVVVVLTFATVLASLFLHVIQFARRKFTLEHSLDSATKNSSP